jgi:hypothetical protein
MTVELSTQLQLSAEVNNEQSCTSTPHIRHLGVHRATLILLQLYHFMSANFLP